MIHTMHVAFLSPHSDPEANLGEPDSGGQCVYEYQLAHALSQLQDTKVTIYCRKNHPRKKDTIVSNNFMIRRVECGGTNFIPKENIEPYVTEMSEVVYKELREMSGETVLHGHYWDGGKLGLHLLAKNNSVLPFIYTPHSLGTAKRKKFQGRNNEKFYNFIPRLTWENYSIFAANKIIVSTDQEKETMIEQYCVMPYKIRVLPPGINFSNFKPGDKKALRKKLHLPLNAKLLLCLGRMSRFKGYQHAIRALKVLQKKYTDPLYLIICGGAKTNDPLSEDYQYLQELQNLAIDLGLEKNVIFKYALPYDRVNEMYNASDIKIISAEHEPFGLTVLEAMACKLPVVATNNGGPSSIINHNETGILVDIFDYENVANYIYSLLKDSNLYQKISENAYQYVRSEYSWEARAQRFKHIYESTMEDYDRWFHENYKQNYFLQTNL